MFLRKVTVILVPLLLLLALCFVLPLLDGQGFLGHVGQGALLGLSLALLLPLSGASRRPEPFAGLLWVPFFLTAAALVIQYLLDVGYTLPTVAILATDSSQLVQTEAAFAAFMLIACIRTHH